MGINAISADEFIENQVSFQLGTIGEGDVSSQLVELSKEKRFPSRIFGVYDASQDQVLAINGCHKLVTLSDGVWEADRTNTAIKKRGRIAGFLNTLKLFSPKKHYAFDFLDGRAGIMGNWFSRNDFPIFQYNRIKGHKNAILWPLQGYHSIGSAYFIETSFIDPIRFEDKEPRICWRGMPTGGAYDASSKKQIGVQQLAADYTAGVINSEILHQQLLKLKRYQFLAKYSNDDIFDVGFSVRGSNLQYLADLKGIAEYIKNPLSKLEQCKFRYLVALSGWDVATSFYWMLNTNSVVFKEEYTWEVFADCQFKPWVHYVPISSTFDDVLEKYQWCEANKSQCLFIVKNAQLVCRTLLRGGLRKKILGEVIHQYENRCHA